MAEFALRSLAMMAKKNPSIQIFGQTPHLGSSLQIYNHGGYLFGLLACIFGLQLVLMGLTAKVAMSVVVTDESFLAISRLLNGITKEFEEKYTLLQGKSLCKVINDERQRVDDQKKMHNQEQEGQADRDKAHTNDRIVYGPLSKGDRYYILHVGKCVKSLKDWEGKRHPNGDFI